MSRQRIKDEQSAALQAQVDDYLAGGGEIQTMADTMSVMHTYSGEWNRDLMSRLQTQKRKENAANS